MVIEHHWLDEHESEQTLRDSEGQGSLDCCSPWSHTFGHWFSNWTKTTILSYLYLIMIATKYVFYSNIQKVLGEISITSDMQMTPPLWQKVKRNLRASSWKWKDSEKAGLKLNIQKTKIITSWQIGGKQWKQWPTIFLGSKITADGDCNHEIKRHLAPWKKSYDQPREQIKKQRH